MIAPLLPRGRSRGTIRACPRSASTTSASPCATWSEARERYERLFGATLEARERVEDQGVDALSMLLGESGRVELLAPLADDTPVGRFLARRGEGMHHLAFGVADLRAELAHLRAAGRDADRRAAARRACTGTWHSCTTSRWAACSASWCRRPDVTEA